MATEANGKLQNPVSGFQYEVWTIPNDAGLDWLPQGQVGFTEVDGLESETEKFDYKEGNDLFTRPMPGRSMPGQITLSRGVDLSNYITRWRASIDEATMLPYASSLATVYVALYNRQGTPQARQTAGLGDNAGVIAIWRFEDCWPGSQKQSALSTGSGEASSETLTLHHTGPGRRIYPSP